VKHEPQPHNIEALVSRTNMPAQGVTIVVSYEQPTGISLAEYLAQVDATPCPSGR
jgi:hypothetical protein